MDRSELETVEAPADGFPTYQFGDDPTGTAQLDVPHGTVDSASAGLFLFGAEVALDCEDSTALCSTDAPDSPTDDLYFGMSMTFASDIPLDGVEGQIINYSFPFLDPAAEPFENLPQFPGDTWQGMNNVVVAESRSPFTLSSLQFTPETGWANGTMHTFGMANGNEIWVFVPFGANREEIEDMRAAINTALIEDADPTAAFENSLPQRIADWISRGRWSVAVHIHTGDFGRDQPSTITAIPHTPRGPGVGLPMPTGVTLLGSDDFGFPPVDTEPVEPDEPAAETATDDQPADNAAEDAAEDAAEAVIDETGAPVDEVDPGDGDAGGPPIAAVGGGIVVAGVALFVGGRRRKGELKEPPMPLHTDPPSGDDDAPIIDPAVVKALNSNPDGTPIHELREVDYVRDDGIRVHGAGQVFIGGQTTYEFPDGTIRRDQEGKKGQTVEIAHPDGTREVWSGSERRDNEDPSRTWAQESSYTRYDAAGDIIEQTDTNTHPWPDPP